MSKGKHGFRRGARPTTTTTTTTLTKHFSFYLKDREPSTGGGRLEYT